MEADGEKRNCPQCKNWRVFVKVPRTDMHRFHWACECCGYFGGMVGNGEKKNRPARHRELVKKYGQGFCEMCLRTAEQVRPGFLNGHHVIEFEHGGSNDRENVWIVCDQCHTMIHGIRKYVRRDGADLVIVADPTDNEFNRAF